MKPNKTQLAEWYEKVVKKDKKFKLLKRLDVQMLRILKQVSTSGESREQAGGERSKTC